MGDNRWRTFRWVAVNRRARRHLWTGRQTACGRISDDDAWRLEVSDASDPAPVCLACAAYARGWVDRHDTGSRPGINEPNPTGYDTHFVHQGASRA